MFKFTLDKLTEAESRLLKNFPMPVHLLPFVFSKGSIEQSGSFVFSFDISSYFLEYTDPNSFYDCFNDLPVNDGMKGYTDLLAKLIQTYPSELLENPSRFADCFKELFPQIKLNNNHLGMFKKISDLFFNEIDFYESFYNYVLKNKVTLCGEKYINYLKSQHESFEPDFYEGINKGLTFGGYCFCNPEGIWKGLLLKKDYQPHVNEKTGFTLYTSEKSAKLEEFVKKDPYK